MVTMSGGSLTTSPTIPTGPSQDQPTPDDGRRSNWSKRRVQSNTTDEDESPNNYNTLRVGVQIGLIRRLSSGLEARPSSGNASEIEGLTRGLAPGSGLARDWLLGLKLGSISPSRLVSRLRSAQPRARLGYARISGRSRARLCC